MIRSFDSSLPRIVQISQRSLLVLALVWLSASSVTAQDVQRNDLADAARRLLSDRCFRCHGPDPSTREADLRLDEAKSLATVASSHDPEQGSLWERIATNDPQLIMPPLDSGSTLSPQERELLLSWMQAGSPFPQHWSFRPITRPSIPEPIGSVPAFNPIDRFIDQRLQSGGLERSSLAERAALLKRVSLDLTGLPPSPQELDEFLQDTRPGAYERAVERLFRSPHYGEHQALAWMEAARYADTGGYQVDWERTMWPWRDWVIDAYNQGMPFDQFTIEQLAGDLLPNATDSQKLATAFHRNHRINDEGGVIPEEFRVEYVVDRVDTTFTIWQGLTMGCVRCHDHKYDPLTMDDFYSAFALFNNVDELSGGNGRGTFNPILNVTDRHAVREIEQLEAMRTQWVAQSEETNEKVEFEREAWLNERRADLKAGRIVAPWSTWVPSTREIAGGSGFELLDDQSLRTLTPEPAAMRYRFSGSSSIESVTAVRLEALPDPTFTNQSLARSVNGNFVLTDVRLSVVRANGEKQSLTLASAVADYAQDNFPIEHAIDADPSTGWAVDGHQKRERRVAVFRLSAPLALASDDSLECELAFESQYAQHNAARVRLSLTSDDQPDLENNGPPAEVVAALESMQPSADELALLDRYYRQNSPRFAAIREQIAALDQQLEQTRARASVPVMIMNNMTQGRETFVLIRGQYDQPDRNRKVTGAVPVAFRAADAAPVSNRLELAHWLLSPSNPLTARVVVNREWQALFGKGIVASVEDFGSQGALPSHPELLDWLASELIDSGWDLQRIQRLIVTSGTYMQSSRVSPHALERDPENLLLSRGPRFRLSGAAIRDQAMAASGMLVRRVGGPSVRPYQPPGLWEEVSVQDRSRSTDFYIQEHGASLYRRGLYTFWKRSVAPPQLLTFDSAARESCVVRLSRTNTPLQALTLLNDVTMVEASRQMAMRAWHEGGPTHASRVEYLLSLTGQVADANLQAALEEAWSRYSNYFAAHPEAATQFLSQGESAPSRTPDCPDPDMAAYAALASIILNMDATITKE